VDARLAQPLHTSALNDEGFVGILLRLRNKQPNYTTIWVHVIYAPVFEPKGSFVFAFCLSREILSDGERCA